MTTRTKERKQKGKEPLSREALALVAQRFKALGDPTRLALLQALFEGELTEIGRAHV